MDDPAAKASNPSGKIPTPGTQAAAPASPAIPHPARTRARRFRRGRGQAGRIEGLAQPPGAPPPDARPENP